MQASVGGYGGVRTMMGIILVLVLGGLVMASGGGLCYMANVAEGAGDPGCLWHRRVS
jgi:hypothetical protein